MPWRDIVDQRTLQSNWTRGTTSHTQPKSVVSDTNFLLWLSLCRKSKMLLDSFQKYWWSKISAIWLDKRHIWLHPIKRNSLRCYLHFWSYLHVKKSKILMDSFQRYWWSKNPTIWLVDSILGNNLRTTFSPDMRLSQNHKNIVVYHL